MKQLVVVLALPLAFACSDTVAKSNVADAERARAEAIARNDTEAYSRLVAADLYMIDRNGEVNTKGDRMAAVDSGRARHAKRVEDTVNARIYGDVAIFMGQAVSQIDGQAINDYFTRIWAWQRGEWRLVGAHYTDTSEWTSQPPGPQDRSVPTLPIESASAGRDAEGQVRRAITEQHHAYWSKDPDRYARYAGTDLLRIAENGVRTREELIAGMRGNARLPAPPSDQLDVLVRVYGNTAVTTWLDQGTDLIGRFSQNRFTAVLARRDGRWQIVHIQSTGVKQNPTAQS